MRFLHKWFYDLKIRQKFILLFLIISLPTLVVGYSAYTQANKMVREQAEANISNVLTSLTKTIRHKTGIYEYMMNQTVYNSKFIYILSNDYANITNLAYDIREYLAPHFSTIKFINKSISEITIYHEQYIPEYYPYIKNAAAFQDEIWYELAKVSPAACTWHFSQNKIYQAQIFPPFLMQRKTAILAYEYNKAVFINEMMHEITEEYGIIISSDDGGVVFERHLDKLDPEELNQLINNDKILSENVYIEEVGLDVTIYTQNRTLITVFSIIALTAFLFVFSAVMLLIAVRLFNRSLVRPLIQMDAHMREVEKGNFEKIPVLTRNDEIGSISRQFSRMVNEINRLVNEVYCANMQKKEAEITALRTQINPHFLYNSLSAITWKALFQGNQEIYEIATSLAQFYRTTLNRGDSLILVEKEIENIKAYVKLQSIFRDNFFITSWNIQPEVYKYHMLNFILQPIIENAIVHGIDSRTNGGGILKVIAWFDNNHITFCIEDNGEGIGESLPTDFMKIKEKGYGIRNVEERIKLYYGDEYGIKFSARSEEGLSVTIRIPVEDIQEGE